MKQGKENKAGKSLDLLIVDVLIGFNGGIVLCAVILNTLAPHIIPNIKQVQQGYVAPSRLEIKCEDLDDNGKRETIIKIDNKPYLLREVDGEPIISAYEIYKTSPRIDYKD